MDKKSDDFSRISTVEELVKLVDFLRSPEGCPWDRDQSSRSLKPYFLEEVYELFEAIETGKPEKLCDELGDCLIHICFQVSLASQAGRFTMADVVAGIRDKMLRRHPHVFGDAEFESLGDQLFAWEQIKRDEKCREEDTQQQVQEKSVLDGLPACLPPLLKSHRIQGRVSKYNFDWDDPLELFEKFSEELTELREAVEEADTEAVEEEIGDILFTAVNMARLLNVHPQLALERTNRKFMRRFKQLEALLRERGQVLGKLTLDELDAVWDEVKKNEQ
ncbi:MAG: nucleoside triphosphate pyrophosphohydrolase [Gemmatimonadota bacterium]|nr:nucleoside triphosphate pyrophosphohydrolase [Gemmatimonadota bacterium]